jgi:putative two-component system response regulator
MFHSDAHSLVFSGPSLFRAALTGSVFGKKAMTSTRTSSADSVLDEIRSTIASFESLRSARGIQKDTNENPAPPAMPNPFASLLNAAAVVSAAPASADVTRTPPSSVRSRLGMLSPASAQEDSEEDTITESQFCKPVGESNEDAMTNRGPARGVFAARTVDKSAKIMIVDDEPLNVMTFRQHLKMEGYEKFVTTSDAREALHLLRSERPDVLLLDIRMPEVSGLDIMRVAGLDPVLQHIPVLILTAASDPATRKQALDLGASDFLQKPIDPNELLPRVRNAIVIKKHYDMASSETARLEQQIERRTRQLEATRQQLILCLARAAEHRDNDTGNHVVRVGRYTAIIARQMGYPKNRLEMLEQAAQLHDVGKIGIPDSILFKPGKLGFDEYELMKRHCALGRQIIEPISEKEWNILKTHTRIGESMLHVRSSSLLMLAARIAQTHHERWDGKGYPLGLMGEDIPLEGRIVAVADVFDALSSKRPYKEPFPRQRCFDILLEGRGTQFDPAVIDAFFDCSNEIVEIQLQLMDEEDSIPKGEWEDIAQAAVEG